MFCNLPKLLLLVVLCCLLVIPTAAAFGKGKDKEAEKKEPKMPKGKEAVDLGLETMRNFDFMDPANMEALLKELQDPEVQAEVNKLMADKKFQREMKKYTEDPEFKKVMEDAGEMLQDPQAMAEIKRQADAYVDALKKEHKGPGLAGRQQERMARR